MEGPQTQPRREWIVWQSEQSQCEAFARELDLHPKIAHLLLKRGLNDVESADAFLNPTLAQMHDPYLMKGMKEGVMLVLKALEIGERIVVHGDYDVDGISSCSVLYEFLRDIGANVSYFIPRRDKEGYGLAIETIRRIQHEGTDLLITTDCGISNVDEIVLAKALGLKTIIVDHHTVPAILPPADAILNPLQPGCKFPFKQLAAVGVAFNFVVGLRKALRERGIFKFVPEPDLRNYMDLVALGTVADVVPLVDENRLFTRFGLDVLSKRHRAGVSALIERACSDVQVANTQTISFQLAPRLNAAGRMGDASICVELLTTRSYARAVELAEELERLNKARQVSEREIMREAMAQAEEQAALERPILVVAGDNWNRGVLGIVASRLMERYNRPAVLLGIEDGVGRGSARSTSGISLIEALTRVSDLLIAYGGHTSAAGVAMTAENVDAFRTRLPIAVSEMMKNGPLPAPKLDIEGQVSLADLDGDFLQDMERLAPFGMGNPEPVFMCSPVRSSRARIVGKKHLRARFHDDQLALDGIGFSMSELKPVLDEESDVALAFVPKLSTRQGRTKLELHIKDLRAARDSEPDEIRDTLAPVLHDPLPKTLEAPAATERPVAHEKLAHIGDGS